MKRFIFSWLAYSCAILLVIIAVTNMVVHIESEPYIYENVDEAPDAQVALIPGAPVYANGVLTPIFTDRVEKALQLYTAGKVAKILVSGDNSSVSHNEVNPVRNYLVAKGVPPQDIFLDHAGFDTYSSMYRARTIFGVTSVLIVSQSFHLPRAVFIARALGIDAFGVSSDSGHILAQNYVREILADEKAVFDLVIGAKPEYLGPTIPITGDGRNYP